MLNKKLLGSVSAAPAEYVEDVFSTYLYTGNGSTQTITNGIDLAGKGGLVWIKDRTVVANHILATTDGGTDNYLRSNLTNGYETGVTTRITAFNNNGFALGSAGSVNASNDNFASWTFRKQPKFFDVVTYTGNGANRTISHNLGSVPGMIIIKCTSSADGWRVYHRSTGAGQFGALNGTSAFASSTTIWNNTTPTSTVFSLGAVDEVNRDTSTYVAYLFAHDAGGFGAAGTDNIISCGSFSTGSSGTTVNLGYEPQFILYKATEVTSDWRIIDNMRGMPVSSAGTSSPDSSKALFPNKSDAEGNHAFITINSTGFSTSGNSTTYIYMAIRRPMKTPTTGTSVFSPITSSAATGTVQTTGFPIDLQLAKYRSSVYGTVWTDRLRGVITTPTDTGSTYLISSSTAAEATSGTSDAVTRYWDNTGFQTPTGWGGASTVFWNFRRATGFFDVVCYTGTGSARTVTHNLGVAPELMIVKNRGAAEAWAVYTATTGNTKYLRLNSEGLAATSSTRWNNTTPTSSVFTVGTDVEVNASGNTYVAYLFASVNGVSKVFSYTGNGTNQTINCGFSGGARFVLIKRTDDNPATSDWYVWDTARGIVSGNDPFLRLNETTAEVTSDDSIDPDNSGFVVNQNATTNINASNATYIGLAIA